ncbi:MAG: erythromycin esterase family protein [Bacteriovoracaceae bacterium]
MGQDQLSFEIIKRSVPFTTLSDFSNLLDKIKDKRIVMLGESSHGTKEFYEWRTLLSIELINNHGFNFIAVEGDWPPGQEINRFIQNKTTLTIFDVLKKFNRWPTWMWANHEIAILMDVLKQKNLGVSKQVGFHGLDLYSLYESISEIGRQLNDVDPRLAKKIKKYYSCFDPFLKSEREYVKSLIHHEPGCQEQVKLVLEELISKSNHGVETFFDAIQNARVVKNADEYYRSMLSFNEDSWNVRDYHMLETLDMLLNHYGAHSKAIVWAHNTHIGDYRATDMVAQGQINLGGIARQKYGKDNVALIGQTTYTGTVTASYAWDGAIEVMKVPKAKSGSLEFFLNQSIPQVGYENYYLNFDDVDYLSPLNDHYGHRAIGVVYHPEHELRGNYVPTAVAKRYDGLVFFNSTQALRPLQFKFDHEKIPDTYPFGTRI